MDKEELLRHARERFGTEPEHLWARYPDYCVLRHDNNRKWYAALMTVSRKTLGLGGDGDADILNVKCSPLLLGSLLESEGFLPAYHMNKAHWVTILLDGTVPDSEITHLLEMSYDLTKGKV